MEGAYAKVIRYRYYSPDAFFSLIGKVWFWPTTATNVESKSTTAIDTAEYAAAHCIDPQPFGEQGVQ
jgi:hypothetical protein